MEIHLNDTATIQSKIDICHRNGGGIVEIPQGEWRITSLTLFSSVSLYIPCGAKLTGLNNSFSSERVSLIYAKDAENITIFGSGIIDGCSSQYVESENRYHKSGISIRPKVIFFEHCKNVNISGVTIINAPEWTIHPVGCEHVVIQNIQILNDLSMANSDGIDPDHCDDVHISNCTIRCADDCIVLKNTKRFNHYGACSNIFIQGCNLTSTSAAFKIGSETDELFSNIIMSDCIIQNSNRGIGIQLRDNGSVRNAFFHHIIIETRYFYPRYWGKAEPIWITNIPREINSNPGPVENIHFDNIIIRGEGSIYLQATEKHPISGVTFDHIKATMNKKSAWKGGLYDRRPATKTDSTVLMDYDQDYTSYACDESMKNTAEIFYGNADVIRMDGVQNVSIQNADFRFEGNEPYYGSSIHLIDCQDVRGNHIAYNKDISVENSEKVVLNGNEY